MPEIDMTAESPRPCPICGAKDWHSVYRQRFIDGPLGEGYDVVVCSQCGAGFADGIPPQAEMDRYYAEQSKYAYEHSGGNESPWDFRRFETTFAQVAPYLPSHEARIIDIGCATGGLLSVFKKHGFLNLLGADPSAACAKAAKRLHGVEVIPATLSQLSAIEERFDLAFMVGVLEHLRDVRQAIGIVSRLLKPGGLLYCAVPDVEGLADCSNAPYQQFSVEHVNFFSSASLRRLMAECFMGPVNSWRWTVEWRENVWEPIASGLYKITSHPVRMFDDSTGAALARYLSISRDEDQKILTRIESLRKSQEPILVWGAGTLARRLLAATALAETNIAAFVDSNSSLHGQTLANRRIIGPAEIAGRKESILICSIAFEKEIAGEIGSRYGLTNRVISLLGDDAR